MQRFSAPSPTLVIDSSIAVWTVMPMLSGVDIDLIDLFADWRQAGQRMVAPMLWLAECTSAVRFAVHRRAALLEEGREAIKGLFDLGVEILPMDAPLCLAALEWAGRLGQARAYDGFYLALADQLGAEFWTVDKRLANAVQQMGVNWVHWVGES